MAAVRLASLGMIAVLLVSLAPGDINLEWRPNNQHIQEGSVVEIGLYAVSDDPNADQLLSAIEVVFSWEPQYLQLLGKSDPVAPAWLYSGFSNDPYGLNEVNPPQDGDGIYTAWASFGSPEAATPAGTLVTTFRFLAIRPRPLTAVSMLVSAGSPPGSTVVFDGQVPNLDVLGTIGSATVTIDPNCPGDIDGDRDVDLTDLALLLSDFDCLGLCVGDIDGDDATNLTDLAILLAHFDEVCP